MANNASLHAAGIAKQDEFYTQYDDIQNELNHYEKHFEGKTVLCNCDDPFESNFCKFFLRNFNYLKLKRLICTSYSTSTVVGQQLSLFDDMDAPVERGSGYVMDIHEVPMSNGRGVSDADIDALLHSKKRGVKKLKGDGDFRSDECINYLKQADIVVTNPPFSMFREYVAQLIEFNKHFLIIGNQNAITYKEIFPLIQHNKMWLGWKFGDMAFRVPDYYEPRATRFWIDEMGHKWRSLGTICWFTNLDHDKRHEELVFYRTYYGHEEDYPKYDNYDAINVDKVADIPCDYFEDMGVPITFLDKYNPEQFEVVKFRKGNDEKDLTYTMNSEIIPDDTTRHDTTRHDTTRHDTTRHDTTRHDTTRHDTENYALLQNCHPTQDVTESWESPSLSLANITPTNSRLSGLPQEILRDLPESHQEQEKMGLTSEESYVTEESLSNRKCGGVMGVPITFLDKYNPEQFEIVGRADANISTEENLYYIRGYKDKGGAPLVNGKFVYKRILIKRRIEQ